MDLYPNQDSLQDFLDSDIKHELDSGLMADLGLPSTADLPPLDLDEALGEPYNSAWFSELQCGNSNSSTSNFILDFSVAEAANVVANPNSVCPMTIVQVTQSTAISSSNVDTLTCSSSAAVTTPIVVTTPVVADIHCSQAEQGFLAALLDKPLVTDSLRTSVAEIMVPAIESITTPAEKPSLIRVKNLTQVTTSQKLPSLFTNSFAGISKYFDNHSDNVEINSSSESLMKESAQSQSVQTLPQIMQAQPKLLQSQRPLIQKSFSQIAKVHPIPQSRQLQKTVQRVQPTPARTIHIEHATIPTQKKHIINSSHRQLFNIDKKDKSYPKPAYSYSCLIAMALKNSKTGSLPVSEIYSFMCEHFPYFKTAPNGWKNSVRHNLSLNKCFEKIEKPSGNGNQRKGCLWAMNPEKIAKMDEEVQKWSKKDPIAIKRAMVYPDNLELLERGEIKREFVADLDDGEDSESEYQGQPASPPGEGPVEFIDIEEMKLERMDSENLVDFEIQVTDDIYDDLEIEEEKVNIGFRVTAADSIDLGYLQPNVKRSRNTIHGNYVYKPVLATTPGSKRKTPLLLRTAAAVSSFVKLDGH